MPLGASYSHFIPDAKLMFRNTGQRPVIGKFASEPLELMRLSAQWRRNEVGQNNELPIWINVVDALFSTAKGAFVFSLEVDVSPRFEQPAVISIYEYTADAVNPFEIMIYPERLEEFCRHATHVRLVMNPTPGAEAIEFSAFPRGDVPRM